MALKAAAETHPLSFEPYTLTPLDWVNLPIHVPLVFVFTPPSIPAGVEALEHGISRLVAQLPFLAGNVVLHPGNGGSVEPPSDKYLEEDPVIRIETHPQSISIIHEPNFGFNDSLSSDTFLPIPMSLNVKEISPVIRFCINVMTDGLILCISIHHAAMDGLGVMNIVRMIGLCCASPGKPRLPVSPLTEASVRARLSNISTDGSFMDMQSYGPDHWSQSRLISCEFLFSAKRIRQLGILCNVALKQSCLEKDAGNGDRKSVNELSTSDVFSALLWLCTTRARSRAQLLSPPSNTYATETTRLGVAVSIRDIRDILKPPIPLTYLGNAMVVASDTHVRHEMEAPRATTATSIDKDEVLVLANLASKVRHTIQVVDGHYVRQVVRHIKASQDCQDASFYFPDTFVTNLRLLDLRQWDFGPVLGQIVNFDHLETRINGLCSIHPRCGGTSGESPWKVRVNLEPEAMDRLRGDALIRWAAEKDTACKL
ncbi:hypothetical protein P170DRAFT_480921 [Aspergillus steynii IBT 23096]|uniref:Trichothecene 3-O-acetyltransferase-like N-terminal domain-containing protein n=1 Tax=Aspergillus steynii IBT 23096 TaxID=1392250 RepID=A0A2I2FTL7_9EURO|nr:uncharacterized protein P170DRAFT_480921 [Aspergillus steynii IBT 23096]PLB43979.1 hypothetical protein P170DRAFT_480921 [Aspergillus steynii IBT 23096]